MSDLVIVESPAKAKTIANYLGKDYQVKATMGHVRDLPKKEKGVDIDGGFALKYEPIEGKEETIRELKEAASNSARILLATDPDREGEAISWHLKELLALPDERAYRVSFNEITRKEVQQSICNPRKIDNLLVDAQQARRALDRIVGYEISPILWKRIRRGLSAGRVQSVATRIVVDREEEIRQFKPDEYWTISVRLRRLEGIGVFEAAYFAPVGMKKAEIHSQEEASAIADYVTGAPFSVLSVIHSEKKRSPAPPFITSTLQQEASRRLNMSPRRTMAIAQQLYEGVQIEGHGMTGLITYMRTDSLRLSEEAVGHARDYIRRVYGESYLPGKARIYKTKEGAQDAHEAIRPSYIEFPPDSVRSSLTKEQFNLYKLIWSRFISCQMENAVYDLLTIDSVSYGHQGPETGAVGQVFRANHTTVKFSGFTAVYEEAKDEENEESGGALPTLTAGEKLSLDELLPQQHFTKPPPRYTQASLIRVLEEKGIGRPSTYAPTISTIIDREYVSLDGKQLKPTPLGEVVTGYMKEKFNDIVDIAFTARMESNLDEVEEGQKEWKAMLSEFYKGFSESMQLAEADTARVRIPDEPTGLVCETCGRPMVIKMGRFGRFIACEGYPECKTTKPLAEETPGLCPLCGAKILKKKTKKGYNFYGCEKYPACSFATWDTPQKEFCEICGKTLFKTRSVKKPFCQNPECSEFLPEDQRGYRKKSDKTSEASEEAATNKEEQKKTTRKKKVAEPGTTETKTKRKKKAAEPGTTETKTTRKKKAAEPGTTETKTTRKKTAAETGTTEAKTTRKKTAAEPGTTETKTTRKKKASEPRTTEVKTARKKTAAQSVTAKTTRKKKPVKSAEKEDKAGEEEL